MLKLFLFLFVLYTVRKLFLKIKKSGSQNGSQERTPEKQSFKSQDAVDAEYKEVKPD